LAAECLSYVDVFEVVKLSSVVHEDVEPTVSDENTPIEFLADVTSDTFYDVFIKLIPQEEKKKKALSKCFKNFKIILAEKIESSIIHTATKTTLSSPAPHVSAVPSTPLSDRKSDRSSDGPASQSDSQLVSLPQRLPYLFKDLQNLYIMKSLAATPVVVVRIVAKCLQQVLSKEVGILVSTKKLMDLVGTPTTTLPQLVKLWNIMQNM